VRKEGLCSNSFDTASKPSIEEVFQELERWHELHKDFEHELRGPRP